MAGFEGITAARGTGAVGAALVPVAVSSQAGWLALWLIAEG